jgi:Ca2+-binding EF-hand superfamily protein
MQYCHALARMSEHGGGFKERVGLADFRSFLIHFYAVSVLWVHFRYADEAVSVCDLKHQQLSLEEFTLAVTTLTTAKGKQALSAEQVRTDFELLDIDKSGWISFSEVVATCCWYIDPKFDSSKPVIPIVVSPSDDVPENVRKLQQEDDARELAVWELAEQAQLAEQGEQELREQREQVELGKRGLGLMRESSMRESDEKETRLRRVNSLRRENSMRRESSVRSMESRGKRVSRVEDLLSCLEDQVNTVPNSPKNMVPVIDISEDMLAELESPSSHKMQGKHLSTSVALIALQTQMQIEKKTAEFVDIKHATLVAMDLLLSS